MMNKPILGILLGDAAGVGPEIVAKLCDADRLYCHCNPIIIGDIRVLNKAKELINGIFTTQVIKSIEEANWDLGVYYVLDQGDVNPEQIKMGENNVIAGKASANMLKVATELCQKKILDGFVFAPMNIIAINMAGFNYESESMLITKYLGLSKSSREVNMLDGLWIARVTSHIPIKYVCDRITKESILSTIDILDATVQLAEKKALVLGIAALNPHAGEMGVYGTEEKDVIIPAIEMANTKGIEASGPYAADTLFLKAFEGEFNAIVTMYHDQGQIALKMKGILYGVTLHANIPITVATCIHGIAYDIVGKGIASMDGLENAIRLVARIVLNKNE